MQNRWSSAIKVSLVFFSLIICSLSLSAQTQNTRTPLIQSAVDEGNLTTLKGNVHPLANAKFDQGAAPDSLLMDRMLLVLKRSSTDEAALRKLEDDQQTKSSPNFHNWLTPEQFGTQFGITDADLQIVTAWLQSKGFQVNRVAAGRMVIEFSGTAGQVRSAFHTEIHKYVVNGEAHWANASDPQIPAALTPVIAGVNSMHNFHHKSMIHTGKPLPIPQTSGKGTPQLTVTPCDINTAFENPIFNHTCFGLGPADFAKTYNIPAAATGAGQTIAIVNDSNICTGSPLPTGCTVDDVAAFRTFLLATEGTLRMRRYHEALAARGIVTLEPDPDDEAAVMDAIHAVKAGDLGPAVRAAVHRIAGGLVRRGAGAVVLGCTELPLVMGAEDAAVPVLDGTEILARAALRDAFAREFSAPSRT